MFKLTNHLQCNCHKYNHNLPINLLEYEMSFIFTVINVSPLKWFILGGLLFVSPAICGFVLMNSTDIGLVLYVLYKYYDGIPVCS